LSRRAFGNERHGRNTHAGLRRPVHRRRARAAVWSEPVPVLHSPVGRSPGRRAARPGSAAASAHPGSVTMAARVRPYLFYDVATSICSTGYRKAEGKIVFQDDRVLLLKPCPEHGHERVLIADDVDYYRRCREVFLKPPEMPRRYNTPVKWGCPYDCGLCT